MSKGDAVMVAVRVRPLSRREIDMKTEICIDMKGKQVLLLAANKQQQKNYSFDHCFWSINPDNPKFIDQEGVFNALGEKFLKNSFQGYNGCVFAYGQTGSGKSYTMMGPPSGEEQRGLIPRLCDALFSRIDMQASERPDIASTIEVSYMEIYNERVRDLLMPRVSQKELKVREHHSLGPYVEGLTKLATTTSAEIERLMLEGNRSRTVAATQMNSESSRSHAVFTIEFRQTEFDAVRGLGTEKVSRISLVDLAGSERASKTGTTGDRLKEGSNINLALTTLGRVISALADISSGKKTQDFVPYRDSVLTWLLKDSLGGNSKTIMIATISPSKDNFEESLSTLRYADRAKRIVNHAVINEDDNSRIIRELKEELLRLKEMLGTGGGPGAREVPALDDELAEKLKDAQNMLAQREQSWGEKLDNTRRLEEERQKVMEEMGISIQSAGIQVKSGHFYLVNMNADPSMNELLVYNVKETTLVGRPDNIPPPDIQLKGLSIQKQHCKIEIIGVECIITPFEGTVYVNGKEITEPTRLYHGYRILLGGNHWFRVNAPGGHANPPEGDSQTDIDISSAKKELAMNDYDSIVSDLKEEKEEALRKLQDDYEQQLMEVRDRLSDYMVSSNTTPDNQSYQPPSELEALSLTRLQEVVLYATDLVRTANQYSEALQRDVKFSVTLRIDTSYLVPRSRFVARGDIAECVAIRVIFPGKGSDAVWTIDMLHDKLAVIAEMYEEAERNREERGEGSNVWKDSMGPDPFCDVEDHSLIGVGNAYLNCLFHFVPMEYSVPIMSPQGKIIGKINLSLQRLNSVHNDIEHFDDFDIPISTGSSYTGSSASALQDLLPGSTLYVRVGIQSAEDLPPNMQFVFLQYKLWGFEVPTTVAPVPDFANQDSVPDGYYSYQHMKTYGIEVSDEFTDYCRDGVLSIEVYGHRTITVNSNALSQATSIDNNPERKWIRVRNYISLTAKVLELNVEGDYSPVELKETTQSPSGGTYQLKQGQSRKIQISVQNVQSSGSIELGSIQHVEIGSVSVRSKQDVPLDSYQEQDFNIMKEKWGHTLQLRKDYLDNEMKLVMDKENKTSEDISKETKLIDEWLLMQQERNLLTHSDFNQILGMSRNWNLPQGFEFRVPIIFIDIEEDLVYKTGAILGESDQQMIPLKFKPEAASKLEVISTWDSSDHESKHLMGITSAKDRVFIVLRVTVALKHPPGCKIRLRKRLNLKIVKNRGSFLANFAFGREPVRKSGVVFEIFCGLPRTEGVPIRVDIHPSILEPNVGESLVQTFRRGMEEISNQLQLDRLRQEISLKEQLTKSGAGHLTAPRSVSPGLHSGISSSPRSAEESESPDPEPIPGIVVSPPIHRPVKQAPILPHSISDTNLFTPPQSLSPVEPISAQLNSDLTPTPTDISHAPKLHVQTPTVDQPSESSLVENTLPPASPPVDNSFDNDIRNSFDNNVRNPYDSNVIHSYEGNVRSPYDFKLDLKQFPPDTRPEDLLTPDLSPNDNFNHKFSGSDSSESYDSTPQRIPDISQKSPLSQRSPVGQRSPLSQKHSAPVRKQDSRRSTPLRSATPDLGDKKRNAAHRMSTPTRAPFEVDFKLNDFVLVELKVGTKTAKVRYIGPFHHAKDDVNPWVGLELSEPTGKHNGTVESKVYFKCKEKHGAFIPLSKVLSVCNEKQRPASSMGTRIRRTGTPLSTATVAKGRMKY